MDIKEKKDNILTCRKDIATYCRRPELELKGIRGHLNAKKAKYLLTADQQMRVLQRIDALKFPYGFLAKLGRHVDYNNKKLVGYKTHDAHLFLERLMLETIFPPSFFDSMEHLPIHVADETLLGGLLQYKWMYP
ncbi:unnamed protein product [Rhodiola kirilowii]